MHEAHKAAVRTRGEGASMPGYAGDQMRTCTLSSLHALSALLRSAA
jgi:hypothetical protein